MQGFQAPAKQGGFGWVQGRVPSPAGKRKLRVEARSEPIQSRKTSTCGHLLVALWPPTCFPLCHSGEGWRGLHLERQGG